MTAISSGRVPGSVSAEAVDGRTARRLANRRKLLDAALALTAEGIDLTTERIAERAGLSTRSVYNHFPTVRDLVAGMYERGMEQVSPLLEDLPDPCDPFPRRVREWVRVRGRIQEAIAPLRWRALVAEEDNPGLQPEIEALRRAHRDEVRRMFPELGDQASVDAVVALTDSLAWRALRKHQGLPEHAACAVIAATIRRLARAAQTP